MFKQTYYLVYNSFNYDAKQARIFFNEKHAIEHSEKETKRSKGYRTYPIQSFELNVNILGKVYYVYHLSQGSNIAFKFDLFTCHSSAVECLKKAIASEQISCIRWCIQMQSFDLEVNDIVYLYWVLKQMRVQRSIKVPKFIGFEIAKALLS